MIRNCVPGDAAQLCRIYNHYIVNTVITFEVVPLQPEDFRKRIEAVTAKYPWIVYTEGETVQGYAYANEWKARAAYRHSVELSIYLDHACTSRGIGAQLYTELITRVKKMDIHALIGGVTLPNPQSVRLHEKLGFSKVAHFPEVGRKFDKWLDVGYWEMTVK